MKYLIELRDVGKQYRTKAEVIDALTGVTLALRPSEVTALMGPSGSGKTTLINLIAGWEAPSAGEIALRPDLFGDWESVAVIPQGLGLLPELTLAENIELPRRLGNRQNHPTKDLLDQGGLADLGNRFPDQTSLGEQQRAAIARALASSPRVLVADEPTAHQDEANALQVARIMRDCAAEGTGVLVATHDSRILSMVDRVLQIEFGRLGSHDGRTATDRTQTPGSPH